MFVYWKTVIAQTLNRDTRYNTTAANTASGMKKYTPRM